MFNTAPMTVRFLMVFVIQRTQIRDGEAIRVELDELIRAVEGRDGLLDLEGSRRMSSRCSAKDLGQRAPRRDEIRADVDETGSPRMEFPDAVAPVTEHASGFVERALFEAPPWMSPRQHADGEHVIVVDHPAHRDGIYVAELDSPSMPKRVYWDGDRPALDALVPFAPDGRLLLISPDRRHVTYVAVTEGRKVRVGVDGALGAEFDDFSEHVPPTLSPTGGRVALRRPGRRRLAHGRRPCRGSGSRPLDSAATVRSRRRPGGIRGRLASSRLSGASGLRRCRSARVRHIVAWDLEAPASLSR